MKQLFLLALLAVSTCVHAQVQDQQWFVKNGEFLNKNTQSQLYTDPTTTANPFATADFYIERVKHPGPAFEVLSASGSTVTVNPRNDFFIIYSNGTHFNSYTKPDLWELSDGNYNNQNPDKNYRVGSPAGETIQYIYYTNVYDGDDDPNAIVSNNQPNEFLDLTSLTSDPQSPFVSNDPFSFNHTIVKGRDVTIILNKLAIQDSIESCDRFNICWDVPSTVNFTLGESDVFGPSASNLDFTLGLSGTHEIINNCVQNISISQFQGPFAYLNFRAPNVIPYDMIGQVMEFSIQCKNGLSWSQEILIDNAHDPNLIDAKCIRVEDDHYYVQYEFLCTNEMQGDPSVSLQLELPAVPVSMNLVSSSMNGVAYDVADIITSPQNIENYVSNNVTLEFPGALGDYQMNELDSSTVRLIFCVKYQNPINDDDPVETQIIGNTTFTSVANGSIDYPIMNQYNLCEDYNLYYEFGYPQVAQSQSDCGKSYTLQELNSSSYCDCKCGPSNSNCFERFFCWMRNLFT